MAISCLNNDDINDQTLNLDEFRAYPGMINPHLPPSPPISACNLAGISWSRVSDRCAWMIKPPVIKHGKRKSPICSWCSHLKKTPSISNCYLLDQRATIIYPMKYSIPFPWKSHSKPSFWWQFPKDSPVILLSPWVPKSTEWNACDFSQELTKPAQGGLITTLR